MKGRKQRSAKTGSSRKKAPSDVSPSTSLPPLVEGQLRCFLRVTISQVLWTVFKPPSATFVRLRWWGESSNGTHFFPRDSAQLSQKTIKTTTRFPIRCGPKQFTSYLADMGSLVPEVLTKPDHLSVARAQVSGISRLSMSHPISGFYTLVSPTSEKLGELQVSLSLEPLVDAYDSSSSSGLIADTSTEQVTTLTVPVHVASFTDRTSKKSPENSSANTPRGKDHLYFQSAQRDSGPNDSVENQVPPINGCQSIQTSVNPSSQESCSQPATDILSVLLQRGNKLRDAMVMSANRYDTHSVSTLKDVPLPPQKGNIPPPLKPPTSPSRVFVQNISPADSTRELPDNIAAVQDCRVDFPADIDSKAVDLLLGSINTSPLPVWDGEEPFPESLSGCSSICEDSELNDPQYDQSLLENLFYKNLMPNTMVEEIEVVNAALLNKNQSQKGSSEREQQQTEGEREQQQTTTKQQQQKPESEPQQPVSDCVVRLSAEQLSLLELIRLARVTIDSVGTATTDRRTPTKGKPAHLAIYKKCTYFVEYTFPFSSPASNRYRQGRAAEGKVIRAVSSKLVGEAVEFHHKSTFPVKLNKTTLEHWWGIDLSFNIYCRRSDQKKPVLVGKAAHPLRCLLQSKDMSESVTLPIQSVEAKSETQKIGPLKVSLELVASHVHRPPEKKKLSWRDLSPSQPVLSPQRDPGSPSSYGETVSEEIPASHQSPRVIISSPQRPEREPSPRHIPYVIPHESWHEVEEDPEVLLHTLLMVPDGKDFSCGSNMAPNVYLNCKLFWCEETSRSVVSWGQANPSFNFVQVTPVTLTAKLLGRMKNNVMVVEVWQKMGSSGQDRLLGLVKLPLHQFYMSFRDSKIAHLLLQAQYPVLGVDGYMPVIDVFTGNCKGNLRVVLAIGRSEQIIALQRARDEESSPACVLVRPVHLLDHMPHTQTQTSPARDAMAMREHVFVIRVERVNGLIPLQSTVWGEADCYVQYSFPHHEVDSAANTDTGFDESSINLKSFRTTTTLCVPDPTFGHTETHVLLAPEGAPVQNLLLSSLSSQGLSSGGGVQFDVWCRYYYPNVRDQLVARGLLPLSKLCAMVTMQRQNPNEAQMFSLPLVPRAEDPQQHPQQPSGLLDVCIRYKHRPIRAQPRTGRGVASRIVTLVVQVHRACGLQAAARILSEKDESFSYFTTLGVNAYVTVQLSFLPETEKRSTRVAGRAFCPEFDHHMEVACDMLLQRSSGESCSLAEQLEDASAVFTIWNRDSRKASVSSNAKDVMLGTVKIPLAGLIHKGTGISGWFGVYVPMETSSSSEQHTLVGGLQISLSFAHHSDRERVIKAARGLGWDSVQFERKSCEDDQAWGESRRKISLTLSMPRAWIPLHCLLLPGHSDLQRSTYCYFRYKFYDQGAFCSPMKHPMAVEDGEEIHATVNFEGSRTVELTSSQPLMWYLQEERLEVQVWAAFQKDKTQRPSDADRLVGSAFIDLSSLAKTHKEKVTLSGVYPLFRRSAADLQGAALRVHITLNSGSDCGDAPPVAQDNEVDTGSRGRHVLEEIEEEEDEPEPPQQPRAHGKLQKWRATPDITSVRQVEVSEEESFPVTVTVDRALNLNLKGCPSAERTEGTPCCCVSYITADAAEPVSTAVIANTNCPVWDHQHECRLSKELLVDPQQSLVFKVWHKGEMERVIGFASVDLSPLLYGLRSVCGWYNITDFDGQCLGQLKVSVTPLKWIQDLLGQRKAAPENTARNTQTKPVSYQTKATYSSFPSHISRYPEQEISSPDFTDIPFSERSSESDRHREHMDSVRLFHSKIKRDQIICACDNNPTTTGFSSLRKKLSELDNMQRYLAHKLSAPIITAVTESDRQQTDNKKREERWTSDPETDQLLLRSSQLVRGINHFPGLRCQHLETIPSNPESNSPISPVSEDKPQSIGVAMASPRRAPVSPREAALLPRTPQHLMESAVEHRTDRQRHVVDVSDEDEEETDDDEFRVGCRKEEVEEEEEEEEDYEEFVLKPRPLNEVTSMTDRTSPWTSVLSEPDLVRLESLESQETEPNQDEDDGPSASWADNPHPLDGDGEDHQSCSSGDASDAEDNVDRTLHVVDEGPAGEEASPTRHHTARAHGATHRLESRDTQLQPPVPNFFLPTHQLEASLRAIRLAPSFSKAFCNKVRRPRKIPHQGLQQPPSMSPTSKRESDRISKIFHSHLSLG